MSTTLRQRTTSGHAAKAARPAKWGSRLSCLALVPLWAGCNSNNSPGMPEPPPFSSPALTQPAAAVVTPPTGLEGYYRGTAKIDGKPFHAEALITADGAIRLYLGAAVTDGASLSAGVGLFEELLNPPDSALFVGSLQSNAKSGTAHGTVIGQACASPTAGRYCGEPADAVATLTRVDRSYPSAWDLSGEVRIETSALGETWLLEMTSWSIYYNGPAMLYGVGGVYDEKLAPFAKAGDVTITVDRAGRLFFQSPGSGCVGNGSLAPHSDGSRFVFDVSILIESCAPSHAFLNGQFAGFATSTQDNYWSYDDWLVMFLSTREGSAASTAAMTTFANRLQ